MADIITVETEPHTMSPDKGSISFAAYVDGHRIECVITAAALKSHFKEPDKPIDQVFTENELEIRSMAEFLLITDPKKVDGELRIDADIFGRQGG